MDCARDFDTHPLRRNERVHEPCCQFLDRPSRTPSVIKSPRRSVVARGHGSSQFCHSVAQFRWVQHLGFRAESQQFGGGMPDRLAEEAIVPVATLGAAQAKRLG